VSKYNAISDCLGLITEFVSFVSLNRTLVDVTKESVFELIMIAKYLSAQYPDICSKSAE
jgi:hypothetical protein